MRKIFSNKKSRLNRVGIKFFWQENFGAARISKLNIQMAGDDMIKGVIFDIDGTLYSYKKNDRAALKCLCEFMEKNFHTDEKTFRAVYAEARRIVKEERLTDGGARHSRVLFFQTALELLGQNPFKYTLAMYDVYWNNFLAGMKPFDDADKFIRKLKSFGKKISLCTDMTAHIQYRKIQQLGLSDFIDFMVTSEETGFEKPSPKMFELALKKMNVKPEEAAYFGDSADRDIVGAAACGIKPFWYIDEQDNEDIKIDCEKIHSYSEVIDSKIFF